MIRSNFIKLYNVSNLKKHTLGQDLMGNEEIYVLNFNKPRTFLKKIKSVLQLKQENAERNGYLLAIGLTCS